MNIIKRKNWYFAISLLVIVPGLVSLLMFGLNLSIDFVPGSKITFSSDKKIEQKQINGIKNIFSGEKIKIYNIQPSEKSVSFNTETIDQNKNNLIANKAGSLNVKEEEYETVGPTIGRETTDNAVKALGIASILIVLYITWSFRSVPKPASSLRFGI